MIKFVCAALTLLISCNAVQIADIPKDLGVGAVTPEFSAGLNTYLDGPKLSGAANESSFEW